MKKTLKKPSNTRGEAIKKVVLYETILRGSVDESCSAPGSKFQACKNKCC